MGLRPVEFHEKLAEPRPGRRLFGRFWPPRVFNGLRWSRTGRVEKPGPQTNTWRSWWGRRFRPMPLSYLSWVSFLPGFSAFLARNWSLEWLGAAAGSKRRSTSQVSCGTSCSFRPSAGPEGVIRLRSLSGIGRFRLPTGRARIKSWQAKAPSPRSPRPGGPARTRGINDVLGERTSGVNDGYMRRTDTGRSAETDCPPRTPGAPGRMCFSRRLGVPAPRR
jgi:hypothetical protein